MNKFVKLIVGSFVVSWSLQFTPHGSNMPWRLKKFQKFSSAAAAAGFVGHLPKGKFECREQNFDTRGGCRISDVVLKQEYDETSLPSDYYNGYWRTNVAGK